MKNSKQLSLGFMFTLLLLVVACSIPAGQSTPSVVPLSTSTNLVLPSATPSRTPAPDMTNDPSSTLAPVTRCHIPICMTSAPAPTLIPDAQERFFSLLENNGKCELPCFLGIFPGKSSWVDANSILQPFDVNGSIPYDKTRSTATNRTYSTTIKTEMRHDNLTWMYMYLHLDVDQNNLVQHIAMDVEIYGNGSTEFRDKHLLMYSLREVFLRNGPPDMIYYTFDRSGYGFDVVYNKLKMVIDFAGNAKQNTDGGYTVCPNIGDGGISSMRIVLASSTDPIDVKTLIGYPIDSNPTFEKATGISLDDFYHLMISDQQPACFQVK